jgi:hypothetical protein
VSRDHAEVSRDRFKAVKETEHGTGERSGLYVYFQVSVHFELKTRVGATLLIVLRPHQTRQNYLKNLNHRTLRSCDRLREFKPPAAARAIVSKPGLALKQPSNGLDRI